MINRLCIIGVGLIGGSLSRALRQAGQVKTVIGCSRRQQHLQRALELGVIDEYTTSVSEAVRGADMIVICVPLGAMADIFSEIDENIETEAVITDVGSAKGSVVAAANARLVKSKHQFVPGHPIAGTEKNGVDASFAELFQGRRVILTPLEDNSPDAVERVTSMWQNTGAEVQSMSLQHHDEVLAATSHLPHVLAFGLVDTLANLNDSHEIFQYAAGGFRDFSRIASSDPVMWRDICLENKDAILEIMDKYLADMELLREAIVDGNGSKLERIFRRAKQARDSYIQQQSDYKDQEN